MNFTREMHLLITAVVMAALVVIDIWLNYAAFTDHDSTIIHRMELCGYVVLTIFVGLAVMYRKDTRMSVLMLTGGIMAYSILYFTDFIFLTEADDLYVAVISLLINFVTVLSIGCAIGYAMGYQHNITRLIMIYLAVIGFMLVPWWIQRYVYHDLPVAQETFIIWLPSILLMATYLAYLARGDIRDMSVGNQLKLRLARVESLLFVDSRAYMDRAEMDRMLGLTDEGWEHFADGPVEKQCSVSITSPIGRKFEITVRKWRGEDFCRAVMNTKPSKGYVGFHFDIVEHKDYEIDGKGITRIYGHDGMFVDIYTENPIIKKDNAVARGLDKVHRQY